MEMAFARSGIPTYHVSSYYCYFLYSMAHTVVADDAAIAHVNANASTRYIHESKRTCERYTRSHAQRSLGRVFVSRMR